MSKHENQSVSPVVRFQSAEETYYFDPASNTVVLSDGRNVTLSYAETLVLVEFMALQGRDVNPAKIAGDHPDIFPDGGIDGVKEAMRKLKDLIPGVVDSNPIRWKLKK